MLPFKDHPPICLLKSTDSIFEPVLGFIIIPSTFKKKKVIFEEKNIEILFRDEK